MLQRTGSVVGKTSLKTITRELVRVSGGHYNVTLKFGIGDLADDVLVCETDYKAVLGGVVFVLRLDGKVAAGLVVSLALYNFDLNEHLVSLNVQKI